MNRFPNIRILRSLSTSGRNAKQIKSGYSIVHERHQLPYWERNLKLKKVELDSGHVAELPEYTHKAFMMMNLQGSQPRSVGASLTMAEDYGSLDNTENTRTTHINGRGKKVEQHGGPELLHREGYMIDHYRMTHDLRKQVDSYKEKILKIVEDQTACRHIALVIGNKGGPRWIPATINMTEGMVVTNNPSGLIADRDAISDGDSYKISSLPIGTKICYVEKIPGMGAELAMSSGRYGIITGRINPEGAEPLVTVTFPYASPEGYHIEIDGEKKEVNKKGIVNEHGLHQRMGGRNDDVWENSEIKLQRFARRNSEEVGSQNNARYKSYFNSMATHRESKIDKNPISLYDQDYALNHECVVTVGCASDGGLFNARLLSMVGGSNRKLYGGWRSNGYRNKLIRKSGRQHLTSYHRKFKQPNGQMVNLQGNRFAILRDE